MARSLNRVQLIGNLTRDPELRYTPTGTAVCTFGIATNRSWTTDTGEKKEETEFHKIVAWNKLGELCSQLLSKGRKVFVEGRIAYRKFTKQDGTEQNTTEIIIDDMMVLDSRRTEGAYSEEPKGTSETKEPKAEKVAPKPEAQPEPENEAMSSEEIADDIPF